MTITPQPAAPMDRLGEFFGPFRGLLTPWGALLFCALCWGITAPFSSAPLAIGLCWWGVALLLWSIQIERPWLNVLPFPPLTVLALHLFLRWELGGLVLLLGPPGQGDLNVWSEHIAEALPINALFTSCLVAAGALNWAWLRKQSAPCPTWLCDDPHSHFDSRRLLLLGVITGLIAVGYAFAGFFGGTLDRGPTYLQWAGKLWRPDTLFTATIRLRDLYFLLLPWLLLRWRRSPQTLGLFLVPTIASLILTSLSGGRGLLLYPVLLTLGGAWLSGIKPGLLQKVVVGTFCAAFIIIISLGSMRDSAEFAGSERFDFAARITAFQSSLKHSLNAESLPMLGRELYAWSDPALFVEPGASQPPARWKRLENLKHLWTPRFLMPDRPEINDGHLIVNEITGLPDQGMYEGRYVSFFGISFGADLYWRFRWPGVIIGSNLFGLAYALICRLWYRLADLHRSTASVLIALYPATFLQGPPLRSVSETAWNWLYEFPKYILILVVLTLLIEGLSRLWPQRSHTSGN